MYSVVHVYMDVCMSGVDIWDWWRWCPTFIVMFDMMTRQSSDP